MKKIRLHKTLLSYSFDLLHTCTKTAVVAFSDKNKMEAYFAPVEWQK